MLKDLNKALLRNGWALAQSVVLNCPELFYKVCLANPRRLTTRSPIKRHCKTSKKIFLEIKERLALLFEKPESRTGNSREYNKITSKLRVAESEEIVMVILRLIKQG